MLLEPVAGVEVLPEPAPVPELADPGVVGVVVAPPLLDELPMPELDEPEPALLRSSRRQVSRCAPVSPTHLLASLPDAPDAAPLVLGVLPEVLLLSEEPEVDDDAPEDGRVVLLPDELPVEGVAEGEVVLLPDEPDEPMPVLPLLEPEDCENAAPESARSAAAVAAVSVFNIIW